MEDWKGKDITQLRNELGLKRPQFAKLLKVSVSTLEKWESPENADKPIKEKYIDGLKSIASAGLGGSGALAAVGLLAAPALLGPAALIGVAAGIAGVTGITDKLNDKNLEKCIEFLSELKKLSPDERGKFLDLMSKLG